MTAQPTVPRPPEPLAAAHANEVAAHIFLNANPLPGTIVARPEGVYITVADADDLDEWFSKLGGEIHRSDPFEGARTWSLHTALPARKDGTRVEVRVMATVVVGESVLHHIRAAVAA